MHIYMIGLNHLKRQNGLIRWQSPEMGSDKWVSSQALLDLSGLIHRHWGVRTGNPLAPSLKCTNGYSAFQWVKARTTFDHTKRRSVAYTNHTHQNLHIFSSKGSAKSNHSLRLSKHKFHKLKEYSFKEKLIDNRGSRRVKTYTMVVAPRRLRNENRTNPSD